MSNKGDIILDYAQFAVSYLGISDTELFEILNLEQKHPDTNSLQTILATRPGFELVLHIISIYVGLIQARPPPARHKQWLRIPIQDLNGQRAIDLIRIGKAWDVIEYLQSIDSECVNLREH